MTHPVWMRPLAVAGAVALALAATGPSRADAHVETTYVVRSNDTLSGIAVTFGTTVPALIAANNLAGSGQIWVGQVLVIRADGSAGRQRGRWRDRHDRAGHAGGAPSPATAGGSAPAALIYVVRPGDTFSGIALHFGVSQSALAAANAGADLSPLRAGQRVRVPVSDGTARVSNIPASQESGPPAASPTPGAENSGMPLSTSPTPAVVGQAGTVEALLTAQAQAAGVSVALVKAVAWQESGWRMVTAADGGIGVMQLMPATVAWIGTTVLGTPINPYDAGDNIRGGVALLRYYLRVFGGDERLAVAAYHQGLGGVQSSGISAATAGYVASVLALEQRFAG